MNPTVKSPQLSIFGGLGEDESGMLAYPAPLMVQTIDAGTCPPTVAPPAQQLHNRARSTLDSVRCEKIPILTPLCTYMNISPRTRPASVNAALMRPGRVNSRHPQGRPQMLTYVMVLLSRTLSLVSLPC